MATGNDYHDNNELNWHLLIMYIVLVFFYKENKKYLLQQLCRSPAAQVAILTLLYLELSATSVGVFFLLSIPECIHP